MPSPNKGETQKDFLNRCMGSEEARKTFPGNSQRFAFCSSQWDRKRTDNMQEFLVANLSGRVRRETLQGREYLVAPMTLIVPGVLNGSKGPLYYPIEEITKNVDAWNHIPITVYHPNRDGMPVSARDPSVLNTQGIGFVFQAKAEDKLTAEAWLDIVSTKRIDNRILDSLEQGNPIELSTGLFTENEPAEEGATFNSQPYSFIARNQRPDHLAILPDQKGACSLDDGCGVLVNKTTSDGGDTTNPDANNSEEESMAKKQLVDELIKNCSCWTEDERDVLNNMDDAKVQGFIESAKKSKAQELVANAAREGFEDQRGDLHAYNEKTGKWETATKEPPTTNQQSGNATANATDKEAKPLTDEQWLASAPQGIRTAVENAMNIEAEKRAELIKGIVANVQDDQREALQKELVSKPLSDLKTYALVANSAKPKEEKKDPVFNYLGMAGAPVSSEPEELEELPLPTNNWGVKEGAA